MKKSLLTYLVVTAIVFSFIVLIGRLYTSLNTIYLIIGGLVGVILPAVDHLVYIYLYPNELTSQRAGRLIAQKQWRKSINLLYLTSQERTKLIFHTAWFQMLFTAFAVFVASSSGSFFGKGLVLAFLIHLLIDQFFDLQSTGELRKWFSETNIKLTPKGYLIYFLTNTIIILFIGLFL